MNEAILKPDPVKKDVKGPMILRAVIAPLFILGLLLLSAGTLYYWQAWFYMLLNLAVILVNLWALRGNRELVEERLKAGPGVKRWDQVYFSFSTLLYFISLVIAGLDVGRYGWTGQLPWWAYSAGVIVYLVGNGVFLWAKTTNRYFSTMVRIQTDRGQTVCREGPYRYIRHPGYIGGMLYMLSGALILGSLWAVLVQALACLFLGVRTALEDRTLQEELPGYAKYAQEVKYRLVPGIW